MTANECQQNTSNVHLTKKLGFSDTIVTCVSRPLQAVRLSVQVPGSIFVTGTLKHVKSSVARSGGIVLQWSSGYGAGG